MIVIDASALAPILCDDGSAGERGRERIRGERLFAPDVIDLEVLSVVRKALRVALIDERRAAQAVGDLADLQMERVSHLHLVPRIWQLRENVTPYDAAYVALAEVLDVTLLTADGPLSRAPGARCAVELLADD